ncbi:hypothetical protein MUK42_36745 [Musa troglodytarum]|uniref:Uncharacterized protein n=1 Tax=Musa troglodytarum TaxID=320322 RepID=A0A9E7JDG9_9LILI|nr:hypothetical protein MUK42_36745 [Musa troglodytarum]
MCCLTSILWNAKPEAPEEFALVHVHQTWLDGYAAEDQTTAGFGCPFVGCKLLRTSLKLIEVVCSLCSRGRFLVLAWNRHKRKHMHGSRLRTERAAAAARVPSCVETAQGESKSTFSSSVLFSRTCRVNAAGGTAADRSRRSDV